MATAAEQGSLRQIAPLNLQGNVWANWCQWKRDFEIYRCALGLDEKSEKRNVYTMLHCMGPECKLIYESFNFDVEEENEAEEEEEAERNRGEEFETVKQYFDEYFKQKKRVRQVRKEFNRMRQREDESVLTYINRLKVKVKECEYDNPDDMVLDRICDGVKNIKIEEKLCELDYGDDELSLEKAVEVCRRLEMTQEQMERKDSSSREKDSSSRDAFPVSATRGPSASIRGSRGYMSRGPRFKYSNRANSSSCDYCGLNHGPQARCPAYGTECSKCKKLNHWARCCHANDRRYGNAQNRQYRNNQRGPPTQNRQYRNDSRGHSVQNRQYGNFRRGQSSGQFRKYNAYTADEEMVMNEPVEYDTSMEQSEFFVYSTQVVSLESMADSRDGQSAYVHAAQRDNMNSDRWSVNMCVNDNTDVTFKIDTQAQCNIVSLNILKQIVANSNVDIPLRPSEVRIRALGGTMIQPVGETVLQCKYRDNVENLKFQVLDRNVPTLLGDIDSVKMGLIARIHCVVENHYESDKVQCIVGDKQVTTGDNTQDEFQNLCSVKQENSQDELQNLGSVKQDNSQDELQNLSSVKQSRCSQDELQNMSSVRQRVYSQNIPQKQYMTCDDALTDYADVFQEFDGSSVPYEDIELEIDETVEPVIHPPRKVPVAIYDLTRNHLMTMKTKSIIDNVRKHTPWVNSMLTITTRREDGSIKVRTCIDPKDLNRALKRSHFPMNTLEDVTTRTKDSKVYGKFDASEGFFQMRLSERSSYLTTFNTPWGRFRYLRLPMGLKTSPELFQRAMMDLFGDLPGVEIVMDDLLVHAPDMSTFIQRMVAVLDRCRQYNLKLNKKKTVVGVEEIDWVGHTLSKEGVKISRQKVKAILDMPPPVSTDQVHRFLALLTYLHKFIPNMSQLTAPLRELLKKDVDFYWDKPQQDCFIACKRVLTQAPVLRYYSVKEPVLMSCDASSKGLGAVIIQGGQPVGYASKALTETEQRYAQIEKEALAIVFGCTRFHMMTYGRDKITVETDHKPLVNIWNKPLNKAPMRLQKMLLQLQPYSIELVYRKGKDIPVPDALSRLYLPEEGEKLVDDEVMVSVVDTNFSHDRQAELRCETAEDTTLQMLSNTVRNGWPEERRRLPNELKPYWEFREEISVTDGIVYRGDRVVIPEKMRQRMLDLVHQAHLGIVKSKQKANDVIYWPNINKQIKDLVSKCETCQSRRNKQQKEPLKPTEIPDRPWSKIAADLFELDQQMFQIVVDYYSNFFEVSQVKDSKAATVIAMLKDCMARYGIPEELVTDGARYYDCHEFQSFASKWGFKHTFTDPYHSQSNGLVENAVKICKQLFKKAAASNSDPYLALLDNRNVPRDELIGSPSQRLMGRRTRTLLPTADSKLMPKTIEPQVVKSQLQKYRDTQKHYYDRTAKELQPLKIGESVRIQTDHGWQPAKVVDIGPEPRSYKVVNSQNREYRRNRKFLLKTAEEHSIPDRQAPNRQRNREPVVPPSVGVTAGMSFRPRQQLRQPIRQEPVRQPVRHEQMRQQPPIGIRHESVRQPMRQKSVRQPVTHDSVSQPVAQVPQPVINQTTRPVVNEHLSKSVPKPVQVNTNARPVVRTRSGRSVQPPARFKDFQMGK